MSLLGVWNWTNVPKIGVGHGRLSGNGGIQLVVWELGLLEGCSGHGGVELLLPANNHPHKA